MCKVLLNSMLVRTFGLHCKIMANFLQRTIQKVADNEIIFMGVPRFQYMDTFDGFSPVNIKPVYDPAHFATCFWRLDQI